MIKVTVVITTYKRHGLFNRALTSVLDQSYLNIEIIIVDDDPESTLDIKNCSIVDRTDIKYIKNTMNKGLPASRNIGLKYTTGDIVMFLDDDDEMHINQIEKLISMRNDLIKKNVTYSFLCSKSLVVTKNFKYSSGTKKIITVDDDLYYNVTGNTVFCEVRKILDCGGYDERFFSKEDHEMAYRLIKHYGNAYCLQEPLHIVHKDHMTPRMSGDKKMHKAFVLFYKKHKGDYTLKHRKYFLYKYLQGKNRKLIIWNRLSWVPVKMYKRESIKIIYRSAYTILSTFRKVI